jgi:hypothetical protein
MDDLIERVETEYLPYFDGQPQRYIGARGCIRELVAALKAAHREIDWLHGELDRLRVRGDY